MAIIFYSGVANAFVDLFKRKVKNSRSIRLVGWIGCLAILIDDHANVAFIGSLFRTLSGKHHISSVALLNDD